MVVVAVQVHYSRDRPRGGGGDMLAVPIDGCVIYYLDGSRCGGTGEMYRIYGESTQERYNL